MERLSPYVRSLDDLRKAMRRLRSKALDEAVESSWRADDETDGVRSILTVCGISAGRPGESVTGTLGNPDCFAPLLEALPHLKLDEGWRLDAVYSGTRTGGKLVFFATDGLKREDFVRHVGLDGSAESVWELRMLLYCAKVFYLFWHANYEDLCIVTSLRRMNLDAVRIREDRDYVLQRLEPEERRRLEAWDMAPSVEVVGEVATIRYCTFSPFGGFLKIRETVRVRPYEIINGVVEEEVSYDCGIRL